MNDADNELTFSTVSLWEIAIKRTLAHSNLRVNPRILRRRLLENQYRELPVLGEHAVAVDTLPSIHNDPFDRMLIAQAAVEGMCLLTKDPTVASYPGHIVLAR